MKLNLSKLKTALKVAVPHVKNAVAVVRAFNTTAEYKHKDKVEKALHGAAVAAEVVDRVL